MKLRRKTLQHAVVAALCAASAAVPVSASADPGEGFSLGKVNLSPTVVLNVGYDSNVRRLSSSDITSPYFELKPSLKLQYSTPDLQTRLTYDQTARFFMLEAARGFSYLDDVAARGDVSLFPSAEERRFGLTLRDSFVNRNYPRKDDLDDPSSAEIGEFIYSRARNEVSAEGRYSPGTALDFFLLGRYFVERLAYDAGDATLNTGKRQPGLEARGRWRFFPETSFQLQANVSHVSYINTPACIVNLVSAECSGGAEITKSSEVTLWSVRTGIGGQVTPLIEANLFVGYSSILNADKSYSTDLKGVNGIIGQSRIVYSPLEQQHFSVGFNRRTGESSIHDYVISNSFTLGYEGIFRQRLALSASGGYDIRSLNLATSSDLFQSDSVVSGLFGVEYRFAPWLNTNLGYRLGMVDSTGTSAANSYLQQQIFAGVRGVY